ncbi:unnamed protein product, partial [Hymenolepis diminuta]
SAFPSLSTDVSSFLPPPPPSIPSTPPFLHSRQFTILGLPFRECHFYPTSLRKILSPTAAYLANIGHSQNVIRCQCITHLRPPFYLTSLLDMKSRLLSCA